MQRIMDPRSTSILNFVATKLLTVANCYKQRELVKKKKREERKKKEKRDRERVSDYRTNNDRSMENDDRMTLYLRKILRMLQK